MIEDKKKLVGMDELAAVAKGNVKRNLVSAISTGVNVHKTVDLIVDGLELMIRIQATVIASRMLLEFGERLQAASDKKKEEL